MNELSASGRLVQRYDHDRYLCALFAPAERREDLFALLAFNHEIAKTRESVTEPMLGQIRLQWWRDSIAGIFAGQVRKHEVVEPLAAAIARHGLSRQGLEELIDAREADLVPEPPATLAQLDAYAGATGGGINALALAVLGAGDEQSLAAARHVGAGWALTGLIRASAFLVRQKRFILPNELREKYSVNIGETMELKDRPELRSAYGEVAALARSHLQAARALRPEVAAAARPILLLAGIADIYLTRLRRVGGRIFDPLLTEPARLAGWRVGLNALLGRY